MSEQPDEAMPASIEGEESWPTHCEVCGTALQTAIVDVVPGADSEHLQTGSPATVVEQDFCPNPECPNSPRPDGAS